MASFSNSLTASRLRHQMILEVNDQGFSVIKTITQTIRDGNQINSPTIYNSANNLSIATQQSATNPTVFSENNGVLYITEGSNAPIALTNSKVTASNLLFSNLSLPSTPDIIKISFTLKSSSTSVIVSDAYSLNFSGSANLRK